MHGESGSLAGGELGALICLALVCAWVRTSRSFLTGVGGGAWPFCIDACAGGPWRDVPGINEAEVGRA